MVVDDSKVIVDRIVPSLKGLSNVDKVLHGFNYEEGRRIADENDIDPAVLDIHLPDKSGIDLLKLIRQTNPAMKIIVIMMTDEATETKKNLCMSAGADYFIDKFEDFENIVSIITNIGYG